MKKEQIAEYGRTLSVPVYDVGPDDKLKLGSVLRLSQETSEQHIHRMGAGYEEMRRKTGMVFFIISTRIRIRRLPVHAETITIRTHPRGRGGAQFYRDFLFYDKNENMIISVLQTTVVADSATHKVLRPQTIRQFGIYPEEIVPPEKRMGRLEIPRELLFRGERKVFYSDLDANGHMNNSVYGDVISDFLPQKIIEGMKEVQIHYIAEAEKGDIVKIFGGETGACYFLRGDTPRGISFTAEVRTDIK